jgi:anti-sigma B factor antagonist
MNLDIQKNDKEVIVSILESRLDNSNASDLRSSLANVLTSDIELVILNISQVELVDSSGLGSLITCYRMLKTDSKFYIVGANEMIQRLFKITRMNQLFSLYSSMDEIQKSI